MATFYLDFENGSDAADGTTFANRWKTFTSGATAARIAPGDTVRLIASPDPTSLGQNATWTQASKTVTLTSAVTANISDCETAWTAATNVTSTSSTTVFKEGTKSANLVVASAFTTGLIAYFPTGALNLSSYQQLSFMLRCNVALAGSVLSVRLCSDAAGVTAVNSFTIMDGLGAAQWVPCVFDNAAALGSSIQSVAIYALSDPGSVTLNIDNVVACKASSSADALTHASLLGKVHNLAWQASTSYSVGDKRKPTPANRNGFQYRVSAVSTGTSGSSEPTWPADVGLTVTDGGVTWTCDALEETWWPIAGINGTTITLDGDPVDAGSAIRGYDGATETVATYKREPSVPTLATSGTNTASLVLQDSGTSGSPIILSGGWNRTDMSTQTGETWLTGKTGFGAALNASSKSYITVRNFHSARFAYHINLSSGTNLNWRLENCHGLGQATGAYNFAGARVEAIGLVGKGCFGGMSIASSIKGRALQICSLNSGGTNAYAVGLPAGYVDINYLYLKNNSANVLGLFGTNSTTGVYARVKNLTTSDNAGAIVPASGGGLDLVNPVFGEANPITAPTTGLDGYVTAQKYNGTAGDHRLFTDGGTIQSATDQRHTASGISWKFQPTSTNRGITYPLILSLAKIKAAAGTTKTLSIWTRRDNTNISGRLLVRGGQLVGIQETYTDCAPTINTWVQSASITVTPSEDGVFEVEFLCWDGVGTTNSFWVDDLAVS